MDVRELKEYIYENKYVEQILESIDCHHIKFHSGSGFWTCANFDGDNTKAIVLYNNEYLMCTNYTRQMIKGTRSTDIVDLVCFNKNMSFPEGLKFICQEIGIDYYHDFDEDIPESFRILKMLDDMNSNLSVEKDTPLKPISEHILAYYKPYVNSLFYEDGVGFETQREFEIGFDEESNRYTIPIRSELGHLIGVKGRYFYRDVPENENKYVYLEPCSKSKILYGLNKTNDYIQQNGRVFVVESEKAVMQLWDYGHKTAVSSGGKKISQYQIDLLVRLGVKIILCFDKDVQNEELEEVADLFPDGVPVYYMYDTDNILEQKESPSDNPVKWQHMVTHNIYKLR